MITIQGVDYPIKPSEMTLKQWTDVSFLIQKFEKEPIMQLEGVLKSIGVPSEVIDTVELSMSKELSSEMVEDASEYQLHDEVDGYKLTLDLPLNIKLSKKIDHIGRTFENPTVAILAFFYRDEKLTDAEHYADAHIKHKMKKFEKLPASKFIVATGLIMEFLTKKTTELVDESK